ncbi:lipoprotein [Spiroplasma endosymbiont of Stenodema calcarata]|uniref:lipoprotein n=1 Tax=Spiroplasma endosymbiont of Stenodema calcarata TaxID=3139328 RepID=UPI003CCB028B
MKKLLGILGTITLVGTGTTSVISCSNKADNNDDPDDQTQTAKDQKTLNAISKRASNELQQYASSNTLVDETKYDISFEKIYQMVTEDKPSVPVAVDNPDAVKILQLIRTGFDAEFDNVNRGIIDDYSNYYVTTKPLTIVDSSIGYNLNYINLGQLAKLTGVDIKNVNAVRLDFSFNFKVQFKELETRVPVTISYILTNNSEIVNTLLSGIITKIAKPIVNYFNQIKSIKIDTDQDFKDLYNNFNIIYSNNYKELDDIVMSKINTVIQTDSDLKPFKDNITFVDSEKILNLVSAPITDADAGNVAGSNAVFELIANHTTAHWSGEGFNPDQLTGKNFLKFYRSIMPIFQSSKGILKLGSFNVNLLKIQVAGFPLSGVVTNNNQNLEVNVEISDQGLDQKLINFGNIISAFNKHYQIKTYLPGKRSYFYVSTEIFDKMKKYLKINGKLQQMWTILMDDFKNSTDAVGLPDFNLFYLDESYKALTINSQLYYIDGDDNMLYPNGSYTPGETTGKNVYWTFDYRFGADKENSFIYSVYSGYKTLIGILKK